MEEFMNRELVMDAVLKLKGVDKNKLYLLNDLILECNDSYLAMEYLKLGGVNSLAMKDLFLSNLSNSDDIKLAILYGRLFGDNCSLLNDSDIEKLVAVVIKDVDLLEFFMREFEEYDYGKFFDMIVMTKNIDMIDRYMNVASDGKNEAVDDYLCILVDRYLDEYKMLGAKDMDKAQDEAEKSYAVINGIINRHIDKTVYGEGIDKAVLFSLITGRTKANIESFSSLVNSDVILVYSKWENRMVERDFFMEAMNRCTFIEFNSNMLMEILSKLYGKYSLEDINKLYDSYFAGTLMDSVYKDFVSKYVVTMDSLLKLRRVRKK